MAWNDYKPRGAAKGNEPDSGGAVLQSVPKFAVVKDNVDPLRCGRLRVYVEGMSSRDPDDSGGWVTVQYMSPFYGQTLPTSPGTGWGEYKTNSHSYGLWTAQPDIGTTVIVLFINGDPNYGVWIGCVPEPAHLQMVPAIGAPRSQIDIVPNAGEAERFGGAVRLPAVNVNSNNNDIITDPLQILTAPRPLHSYTAGILWQQGLLRDPLRGAVGSSAQREAPSRVTGISTPGRPIYSGGYTDGTIAAELSKEPDPATLKVIGRRGGHSIVMDDGDIIGRDQMIRIRTALGHQILMSDDGQCLSIIHSNGRTWIEMGKEGTIDMYSDNSVNIRTQGDLNLHADNNININAKKALNFLAETVAIQSDKDTTLRVGGNYNKYIVGNYSVKVDGTMSMASAGEGSYYSATTMYINGKKRINLNTGQSSAVPQNVTPLKTVSHYDSILDSTKGWISVPNLLTSVVTRAPTHMPWDSLGTGLPVKVKQKADNVLPTPPQPSVATSIVAASSEAAPNVEVSPALTRTLTPTQAVSSAIGSSETAAAVVSQAAVAASGPAADAATLRGGVTDVDGTVIPVMGKTAITPQQAEIAGIMKPGSSTLVSALVQSGKELEEAAPEVLFMGASGAANVVQFSRNISAQGTVLTQNLQQAQRGLQSAGVISGRESGDALVGPVIAAATNGVNSTVQHIRNTSASTINAVSGNNPSTVLGTLQGAAKITGTVASSITNSTRAVTGSVAQMMNLGSRVKGITNGMGGGRGALNSITGTINAVTGTINAVSGTINSLGRAVKTVASSVSAIGESLRGSAASTYSSIKNAIPNLKAGEPQNTRAITEAAVERAQGGGENVFDPEGTNAQLENNAAINRALTNSFNNTISGLGLQNGLGGLPNGINSGIAASIASGAASAATNSLSSTLSSASTAARGIADSINTVSGTTAKVGGDAKTNLASGSGIAGGLSYLPGAVRSVTSSIGSISGSLSALGINTTGTNAALRGINTGLYSITSAVNAGKSLVSSASGGLQSASNLLSGGIPKLGGDPSKLVDGAIGGLASTTNQLGSLSEQIKGAGGKLENLATKNLSPALQGEVNSAIAAVNSGDTVVVLPTTAVNTVDYVFDTDLAFESITGGGVTPPPFTGNPATFGINDAVKALDRINKMNRYIVSTAATLNRKNTDVLGAIRSAQRIVTTFPEGSPEFKASQKEIGSALGDVIKVTQSANTIINTTKTIGGSLKRFTG